jgi:hypothetical protein
MMTSRSAASALAALFIACGALSAPAQDAAQRAPGSGIPVRFPEATVHGFLELRTEGGELLAHGDLLQIVKDKVVESRLVFHFADSGTVFDETVHFTQNGEFALQDYHLSQRGSIFPFAIDATLSRDGEYIVKTTSKAKDAKEKQYKGKLSLPADAANGLAIIYLKNIGTRASEMVHIVAFTPEPRVIALELAPAGASTVKIGGHTEQAEEFALKPKLGAALAFFAKIAGKLPPDSHVWIVTDDVPAFVRFEGPMYMGAVWRLTLASPAYPPAGAPAH